MATREATVTERVAVGAARLDDEWDGWEAEIDLDLLDMSTGHPMTKIAPCGCILTQLYGDYATGKAELVINGLEAEELGFEAMGVPLDSEYNALGDAWTVLIANRRVANQVIPDLGGYDA